MKKALQFVCPFEITDRKQGRILDVELCGEKRGRLAKIRQVIVDFHADVRHTAIRFILPRSLLLACASLEDLRVAILPYQAELVAADIDVRCRPFLDYYREHLDCSDIERHADCFENEASAGLLISQYIESKTGVRARSVADISSWLESLFGTELESSGLKLYLDKEAKESDDWSVFITPAFLALPVPKNDFFDRVRNQNLQSIVRCPFYPETFGRYSQEFEIVVTREVDVNLLRPRERQSVQYAANVVLRAHGVQIENLHTTTQPVGLWVPE